MKSVTISVVLLCIAEGIAISPTKSNVTHPPIVGRQGTGSGSDGDMSELVVHVPRRQLFNTVARVLCDAGEDAPQISLRIDPA